MSKIFGIGLSRTGTTSLTEALKILGYSAIHLPVTIQQIQEHDASTDTSIAMGFEFLDLMFPGSKFICTTRKFDPWLKSMRKFFSTHGLTHEANKIRRALYGGEGFFRDDSGLLTRYSDHLLRVRSYFYERRDKLLVIDLCNSRPDNDKWGDLCNFLKKATPDVEFPHLNASP